MCAVNTYSVCIVVSSNLEIGYILCLCAIVNLRKYGAEMSNEMRNWKLLSR